MKPWEIEKPLMMLDGRYSDFEGVLIKLFFTAIATGVIGTILGHVHPLFMLPCYVVVLLLIPIGFALKSVARRYEQEKPHYLASRSKIRALTHYLWVIGVYLWIAFWLAMFFRAIWRSYVG